METQDNPTTAHLPEEMATYRRKTPGWKLLLQAIGGPRQVVGKIGRMAQAFYLILNVPESSRRLRRLQTCGYTDRLPTHLQLIYGSMDQLRFYIVPAADDFYRAMGINFTFHQVLRVVNDPVAVMDPIGIRTPRQGIITHLLQVVHTNPIYDLQLLEMFPDGLDEMERQAEAMVRGTHPRYRTILAVNEDPSYFPRLLDFIRRWRVSHDPDEPFDRRQGLENHTFPFLLAEYQFRTLPGFLSYVHHLPRRWSELHRHYRQTHALDFRRCDPAFVARAAREATQHGNPIPKAVEPWLEKID